MMRTPVQDDFVDRVPVQSLKHRRVLRLHMGIETLAAARMRRADGKADQRRAERRNPPVLGGDGKPRAPPNPRLHLVDTHRADDFLRGDGERREGNDRDRYIVDRVAVVACEDFLLVAKHRAPQRGGLAAFPRLSREFDAVFRRQRIRGTARRSCDAPPARRSKAPNRPRTWPQPALMSVACRPRVAQHQRERLENVVHEARPTAADDFPRAFRRSARTARRRDRRRARSASRTSPGSLPADRRARRGYRSTLGRARRPAPRPRKPRNSARAAPAPCPA